MVVTAEQLVRAISHLPKDRVYHYVNPATKGQIKIVRVDLPEGPVIIKRWNPHEGETESGASDESISTNMLWRVANAVRDGVPLNIDRVVGASYNTRSVLEALLAHTPQFYFCYPGRNMDTASIHSVQRGHKHLLWCPSDPHPPNTAQERATSVVISEIPAMEATYEAVTIPPETASALTQDINLLRRHAQIQVALIMIGKQLGFRSWIAQNDQGIIYRDTPLGRLEGVVIALHDEPLLRSYAEAVAAALLIDCIWFKNAKLMPAVMEVEHTTGVTSGLTRMRKFKDTFPPFPTRYVIVAPDEEREKVVSEANKDIYRELNVRFFPYSAVEELYALCQHRKIRGVTEEFLDCYMEAVVTPAPLQTASH